MAEEKTIWWQELGAWFGNIANLTNVVAFAIIIYALSLGELNKKSVLIIFLAFGAILLTVFLRYADIGRFKKQIPSNFTIPPLGIARGSVRAMLAFALILGFGIFIYFAKVQSDAIDDKVFGALVSMLSAVIGFYFGAANSGNAAVSQSVKPEISSINPKSSAPLDDVKIVDLAGSGFQDGAKVKLINDSGETINTKPGVKVVKDTKITCSFDLEGRKGKWDVVVTNPDNQMGALEDGFEIIPPAPGNPELQPDAQAVVAPNAQAVAPQPKANGQAAVDPNAQAVAPQPQTGGQAAVDPNAQTVAPQPQQPEEPPSVDPNAQT